MKWLFVIIALLLALSPVTTVFAIADPDSPPQINAVYVYDFGIDSDTRIGVLVDYTLEYAAIPTDVVTDAYLVVFVDADGVTQLESVAPYTFNDNGYGRGVAWIPFTNDEVIAYGLDSVQVANYRIWLIGNPTVPSGWAGDPPKTIATIDQWYTTGDPATLLAGQVLYYADLLELIWSINLIEVTALGNRLATLGESYFQNVIAGLRTLAPDCFSASIYTPFQTQMNYSAEFSVYITNGTGVIAGAPMYLSSGSTNITATSANGTFTIDVGQGTSGNISDGTGTILGGSGDLAWGENEITITGAGTLQVNVVLDTPGQAIAEATIGTGLDITNAAALFSMNRLMFSSLVWVFISIIICAFAFGTGKKYGGINAGGSTTMVIFGLCLIGGYLLGLLDANVMAGLAWLYSLVMIYMLFYRNATSLGRTTVALGVMWFITSLIGGLVLGVTVGVSSRLTADITATSTTIPVVSTEGFGGTGIVIIGDESIGYGSKNSTALRQAIGSPMVRGFNSTTASAHYTGDIVRTQESGILNNGLNYTVAIISDASGLQGFVNSSVAVFNMLISFIFLPLAFLGTGFAWFTVLWGLVVLGLVIDLWSQLAGGRRV